MHLTDELQQGLVAAKRPIGGVRSKGNGSLEVGQLIERVGREQREHVALVRGDLDARQHEQVASGRGCDDGAHLVSSIVICDPQHADALALRLIDVGGWITNGRTRIGHYVNV